MGEVEDYAVKANYATGIVTVTKLSLNIYPNPAQNTITLDGEDLVQQKAYIYDMNGKLVKVIEVKNAKTIIDISQLATGLYIIECNGARGNFIKE